MTTRKLATGKIQVKTWETTPFDTKAGPSLNEIRVTEDFVGDIVGEGAARMLQVLGADGTASFVAVERIVATLDGRSGSFVLQDEGALAGNRVKGTLSVDDKNQAELKTIINRIFKAEEDGEEVASSDFKAALMDIFEALGGDVMQLG